LILLFQALKRDEVSGAKNRKIERLACLIFDPWWRCALSLDDTVHEEFFAGDEGIAMLSIAGKGFATAFDCAEVAFITSLLH